MKKKTRLLSLLACLSTSVAFGQAPTILFQDDFETAEPDGTPSIAIWGESDIPRITENQWIRVTSENSEFYFGEADNHYLHLYSNGVAPDPDIGEIGTGSNWISTQNNEFAGSSVISVHFDFHRTTSTSDVDPKLRFGQGNPIFGNDASRYTVYFSNNKISGQPVVLNDQTYHFQVVYNNTANPVTYLEGQAVVKPDSYDVWIDGVRVMTNVKFAFNTASDPVGLGESLTSIGIGIWGTGQAEFRMDNLVIYDGAYAEGEPPPVIEDQVIFADDFSNPTEAGWPDPDIWKRNPTRVAPPARIIEIIDTDSETYFGEAGNNYMRMYHDGVAVSGENTNMHITAADAFEPTSSVITVSFDFYEPPGVGTGSDPAEILPGISTVGNSQRIHKLTLHNGAISGVSGLYTEGVPYNVQAVFNNSYEEVSYLDGAVTVASDSFDVWLNGRRVIKSASYNRGGLAVGADISSAQFIIWAGRNQEIFYDNIQVLNYPHVENPDLNVYPAFADDFSEPLDGKPNADHWNRQVASALPPNRVIEVTDADSETYFGEPGNNYMRIFHDGTTEGNLNLIAYNRFNSNVITISFDFFEPEGFGEGNFVLRPGTGSAPNGSRIHEITFSNGNLSGRDEAYSPGAKHNVQIVMNNSTETVTYFDGAVPLISDTYDVWLDGELILHNHTYVRGSYELGSPLTSVMFVIWADNSNEFLIDNLEIFNEAYVRNVVVPELPGPPAMFADDFSSGWFDNTLWNDFAVGEWPPSRVVEITNQNSESYFGEAENGYLRVYHNGTANEDLTQAAMNVFGNPSPVITVSFDFFEPAGVGNAPLTLDAGINRVSNNERIHQLTFSNGTLNDIAAAYEEGVQNNIQVVMNNSAEPVAYYESNISKTVAPDTLDVWINGELILEDYQYNRGGLAVGTDLSSLLLGIPGDGGNEFLIDNLEVFDYATARSSDTDEGVTFADWAAAHLPEGLRGPGDDAAGDGVPNIVKFVLGLDPLTPDRGGLPTVAIVSDGGETRLSLTSRLFLNAIDVDIAVEASSDLVAWTSIDVEPELIEMVSENVAIVRVIDTETIDASSRRFLRLSVTQD